MRSIISFFIISLLILPGLFSQNNDALTPEPSKTVYLGMVCGLEGDRLIIPDRELKTNGNYLVFEDISGRIIDRKNLHFPFEAMAEYDTRGNENVVSRLVILKYYELTRDGRLVPVERF